MKRTRDSEETAMFRKVFPILSTSDMDRSLHFYEELLRGTVTFRFPPEGPPGYVSVTIGESSVGIGLDAARTGDGRISLWVDVDDCDQAVAHLEAAGVVVVARPEEQPWGERVARVLDPDGNEVYLGQPALPAEPEGPTGLS